MRSKGWRMLLDGTVVNERGFRHAESEGVLCDVESLAKHDESFQKDRFRAELLADQKGRIARRPGYRKTRLLHPKDNTADAYLTNLDEIDGQGHPGDTGHDALRYLWASPPRWQASTKCRIPDRDLRGRCRSRH
jgi:hypothetical protein